MIVNVYTPLGERGKGGIDRLMDELRLATASAPHDIQIRYLTTRGKLNIALSPFFLATTLVRTLVHATSRTVDVAHVNLAAHGSTYRKGIVCFVLRLLKIPYVVQIHGADFPVFWDYAPRFVQRAIDSLLTHATKIIVLGRASAILVANRLPNVRDRIQTLPNATRTPAPYAHDGRSGPPNILFLGELGSRKGVPQLVSALSLLDPSSDWRATIAGNGDIARTRSQVERHGMANRVEVPGWLSDKQVQVALQNAAMLVLPSFEETLPMCIVEAFAHGLPVIATPVGVISDVVEHEKTGLLVQPGDVMGLKCAMERLLSNPGLREQLGAEAQKVHRSTLEIQGYFERLAALWRNAANSRTVSS